MAVGVMEVDTPYDAKFAIIIMFNTNINEMESSMNRQNKETQNILLLILANQGIGTPILPGKAQKNNTSGVKWVDAPNGTRPPKPYRGANPPSGGT